MLPRVYISASKDDSTRIISDLSKLYRGGRASRATLL